MVTGAELPIEEGIVQLLEQLGIERTHVVAAHAMDWHGLVLSYPQMVSSLTLVSPGGFDPGALEFMASRFHVLHGDQGPRAEIDQTALSRLPEAKSTALPGAVSPMVGDLMADHSERIGASIIDFAGEVELNQGAHGKVPETVGEVAGITYRIQGSGPPLLLFPIGYSPSQWESLLPSLSQAFCTISLSGPLLGLAAVLEEMGSLSLRRVVSNLVDELELQPGQRVLDVGCGTGVHDRWLVQRTGGANPITGLDSNAFLLREAAILASTAGVQESIEWQEGSAEALPFPDNSFDATFSVLVGR